MKNKRMAVIGTAAVMLAVFAASSCSCARTNPDEQFGSSSSSVISSISYSVDIRKDSEPTESSSAPVSSSEPEASSSSSKAEEIPEKENSSSSKVEQKPQSSPAPSSSKPASSSKPVQSSSKPASSKPAQSSVQYDKNGFPKNPKDGQEFTDKNGIIWSYNVFFGWINCGTSSEHGGMEEFPDNYGEIGTGEQILF